ncbi:MAG: hypothetical protein WEB88_03810 [Gemmatimonadota bacterium]
MRGLMVAIPDSDHGAFSDDPPMRVHLGLRPPEHARSHGAVVRAVLDFLAEVMGR